MTHLPCRCYQGLGQQHTHRTPTATNLSERNDHVERQRPSAPRLVSHASHPHGASSQQMLGDSTVVSVERKGTAGSTAEGGVAIDLSRAVRPTTRIDRLDTAYASILASELDS